MSHSTSLAIVSDAVAGDSLERIARSASEALGRPVTVIRASLGEPSIWPAEAVPAARLGELASAAKAIVRLISDGFDDPRHAIEALVDGPPPDVDELIDQGRRHGVELAGGAVAICGIGGAGGGATVDAVDGLFASVQGGRVVGLVPPDSQGEVCGLVERLRAAGWLVGVSAPRREPALLGEAVREAMLLAELLALPDAGVAGQEDTYRLLIGVLLRDPGELEQLRASTIAPLVAYDAEHETELLVTLRTFLTRHGSTTETAEAMRLHRHTVGYRLARVHEVSRLSPHESDGRERLSLGMKAAQILGAWERLLQPG
jgi:PucR C-terminal helix-turn-helix domain